MTSTINLTVSNVNIVSFVADCVEQLKASADAITDDSLPLQSFCATLEQILLEGARSMSYKILKAINYWRSR